VKLIESQLFKFFKVDYTQATLDAMSHKEDESSASGGDVPVPVEELSLSESDDPVVVTKAPVLAATAANDTMVVFDANKSKNQQLLVVTPKPTKRRTKATIASVRKRAKASDVAETSLTVSKTYDVAEVTEVASGQAAGESAGGSAVSISRNLLRKICLVGETRFGGHQTVFGVPIGACWRMFEEEGQRRIDFPQVIW
jgi:hypothetical protein